MRAILLCLFLSLFAAQAIVMRTMSLADPAVLKRAPATPPITFRAASANISIFSATIDLTKPSGTVAGDVLVLVVALNVADTITWPSGFTQVQHATLSGGADFDFGVAWKLAGGAEPATYTVTFGAGPAASVLLVAYSGCNSSPFDLDGITSGATGTTITTQAITPSQNNSMLLGVTVDGVGGSTVTYSQVSGFPLRVSQTYSDGQGFPTLSLAEKLQTTATSQGVQISNNKGAATYWGYTLSLKPQ